jgi:hypothetical protein
VVLLWHDHGQRATMQKGIITFALRALATGLLLLLAAPAQNGAKFMHATSVQLPSGLQLRS